MAVIREDRKFGIQPIGVVKASRGGEIVANAVTKSAQQIGEIAYKVGARQAEKRGTEEAMAAPKETIIGFDPATGNPTALTELSKMGTIRADAYERIVLRRFEQSMEEELRNKSSEIAMQNQDEATYNNLFSTYIAGMAENATGLYKEYITNTGSVIQGRTALSLREQAIRRAQAQADADRAKMLERSERIAFANAVAGGEANYESLIKINSESGQDVAEFTGGAFNLTEAEQNIRYNDALGFSIGRLGEMTSAERNDYTAWLMSGGKYNRPVSGNVNALQARVLNAFGNDPAKIMELGSDLRVTINSWNGMETQADRDAAALSTSFTTANLELNNSLESNAPLNTARSDVVAALNLVDQYSNFDIGELSKGGDNTGAINTRIANVGNLRGQVSTGIVDNMLDAIGPTIEELQDFKNQLQNGDPSGLINAYRQVASVDETTAERISKLLGATDPAVYTAQLDNDVQYLELKQERATEAADAIFGQLDAEALIANVRDGSMEADAATALIPAASSIAEKTTNEIRAASQVRNLSIAITDSGPMSSDLADELVRASISLADFNKENFPNIFSRGLENTVKDSYENVPDDIRRQTVSRMVSSMPNADALTVAAHSTNADQIAESINDLTTGFGSMQNDQIIEQADVIRGRLNENGSIESDDRLKLLADLNSQVAEVILSRELSGINPTKARLISEYIGQDVSNERIIDELGQELGQTVVDAVNGLDADQRNSLKDRLNDNISGNIAATAAREESNRIAGILNDVRQGNGIISNLKDGDIDQIVSSLLLEHGIVDQFNIPDMGAVPPDLFTNYSYWVNESGNEQIKNLAIDMAGLMRRGIIHPQLRDALSGVANGQFEKEEAENILNIYAGASTSMSPESNLALRNVIETKSGLSAQDIGVLDAMSRLRSSNASWDIVMAQARTQTGRAREEFVATYGATPEQIAKDAANRGLFTTNVWENNPSLRQTWTDYVLGLSLGGTSSASQIEEQASQYIKGNFVEDPYITKFGSPYDRLTNIPFEASFSSPDTAAVATMLVQLEAFENYGREMNPNASRAEQVAIGRQFYTRTSSPIGPRGKDLRMTYGVESYELMSGDFDLRGRTAFTFILPENANPSDPVFYLSSMNQNGGVDVLRANPVRVGDPRYRDGVAVLNSVRQSQSDNYAAAAWDAMTEFYLGAN